MSFNPENLRYSPVRLRLAVRALRLRPRRQLYSLIARGLLQTIFKRKIDYIELDRRMPSRLLILSLEEQLTQNAMKKLI